MRGTGLGTSLMLIAIGAILAFAVHFRTTGIDINTVGLILMVVGLVGLVFAFTLGEMWMFPGTSRNRGVYYDHDVATGPEVTPPHTHREVETSDVVYEDSTGAHTERVTRTRGRPAA